MSGFQPGDRVRDVEVRRCGTVGDKKPPFPTPPNHPYVEWDSGDYAWTNPEFLEHVEET